MKRATYRDDFDPADYDDSELPERSSNFGISLGGLLLVGAVVASVMLVRKALDQSHLAQATKKTEQQRDKILKDTYPASDPPASQYFDIPVNRRVDGE